MTLTELILIIMVYGFATQSLYIYMIAVGFKPRKLETSHIIWSVLFEVAPGLPYIYILIKRFETAF